MTLSRWKAIAKFELERFRRFLESDALRGEGVVVLLLQSRLIGNLDILECGGALPQCKLSNAVVLYAMIRNFFGASTSLARGLGLGLVQLIARMEVSME